MSGDGRFVLLATLWMKGFSGTPVVTRNIARGLLGRGWRVAVYAREIGGAANQLLTASIPVINELGKLGVAPDLIQFTHHPTGVPTLVAFPDAPLIQFCQDADAWHEHPVDLERIRRHLAVDEACRDRLVLQGGIPNGETGLLLNAIDVMRTPRSANPPPDRPRRALIVANRHAGHVPAIEAACGAMGVETTTVGYGVGKPIDGLEPLMLKADVVFGAARVALEAMAVGCAAIVCDARGFAGLATPEVFDDWRLKNFGRRVLLRPVTPQAVKDALAAYDAAAAFAVTERVRAECSLERQLDQLEAIYEQVLADHAAAGPVDRAREASDLAAYLNRWLPRSEPIWPWQRERDDLIETCARLTAENAVLSAELEASGSQRRPP